MKHFKEHTWSDGTCTYDSIKISTFIDLKTREVIQKNIRVSEALCSYCYGKMVEPNNVMRRVRENLKDK